MVGIGQSTRADVTLTMEQTAATTDATQTASTAPPNPVPRTMTLSFHGDEARLELGDGLVLLYNGKEGTVETLHTPNQTYDMTFLTQLRQASDPLPPGVSGHVTTTTHLDLEQTDQTMTLVGVTAHKYLLTGTISYTRPESHSYGGRGGHHHGGGGGGFPGGGFPFNNSAVEDQNAGGWNSGEGGDRNLGALPQYSIGGEVWLSDAVKLPSDKDATSLPLVQIAAASAGPFLQPLTDALDKKKDLPLLTRITITRTLPPTSGEIVDAYGGVMEGNGSSAAGPSSATTATTMTVTAISALPVAENRFEAPDSYRLIPAPLTPFDPGAPLPSQSASTATP